MELAIVVSLASVLVGPLIAYLVASRRLSGKIQTSEASELWKESASMREDYRSRLENADRNIEALEASNADLRAELNKTRLDLSDAIIENNRLRRRLEELENGGPRRSDIRPVS